MRKRLFLAILRDDINEMISDQPIVAHRFVLYGGDAVSGPLSYSWAGSWEGRLDVLGREVWFTRFGPATSNVAKRSFNLVIPHSEIFPAYPMMDDQVVIYDADGETKGVFRVNFVVPFEINGEIWKLDINVEQIQP